MRVPPIWNGPTEAVQDAELDRVRDSNPAHAQPIVKCVVHDREVRPNTEPSQVVAPEVAVVCHVRIVVLAIWIHSFACGLELCFVRKDDDCQLSGHFS